MEIRVYYEDTDAAGVVYHANYLNYFERARTEFFRNYGYPVAALASEGFIFPVVRMEINFTAPAVHDDLLVISTFAERVGGSSILFRQQAIRKDDGKILVEALVTLACVTSSLKARRIPLDIRQMLQQKLYREDA